MNFRLSLRRHRSYRPGQKFRRRLPRHEEANRLAVPPGLIQTLNRPSTRDASSSQGESGGPEDDRARRGKGSHSHLVDVYRSIAAAEYRGSCMTAATATTAMLRASLPCQLAHRTHVFVSPFNFPPQKTSGRRAV